MLPELLDVHLRLARDHGLFPVLPRSIAWAPDPSAYGAVLADLDAEGAPVVDHCRGTLAVDPAALEREWRALVSGLQPGLTHLALHCTAPGDFAAVSSTHAGWRFSEYDLVSRGVAADLFAAAGVAVTSTRALQRRWRDHLRRTPGDPGPGGAIRVTDP